MKRFAAFIRALGQTRDPSARAALLDAYLRSSSAEEATWTVALLLGFVPRKVMSAAECRSWFLEASGLPEWLAEVCHIATEDPGETAALGLPPPVAASEMRLPDFLDHVAALASTAASARREGVIALWQQFDPGVRLVCNALLLGTSPVLLPAGEAAKAVAAALGGSAPLLEHRLQESWDPGATPLAALAASTAVATDHSRPYPFAALEPLVCDLADLGDVAEWLVSWHEYGPRAQLVCRGGEAFLWGESGELRNARFPRIAREAVNLPDGTVIEGILTGAEAKGKPSRRAAGNAARDRTVLNAIDLHEVAGQPLAQTAYETRQARLRDLTAPLPADSPLRFPRPLLCASWDDVRAHWAEARRRGAAGLSLRRRSAGAHDRDASLIWPVEPLLVTTVLLYAEQSIRTGRGYGRFTVAVWDNDRLTPVAAVPPDLSPEETAEVASYIAASTVERFGPVRTVRPGIVLEIAFDRIEPSARRKSGLQLRGARLLRWRRDVPPEAASTLQYLRSLLIDT